MSHIALTAKNTEQRETEDIIAGLEARVTELEKRTPTIMFALPS
jgi:hypothetical protein